MAQKTQIKQSDLDSLIGEWCVQETWELLFFPHILWTVQSFKLISWWWTVNASRYLDIYLNCLLKEWCVGDLLPDIE